jgi:hypothetical protein
MYGITVRGGGRGLWRKLLQGALCAVALSLPVLLVACPGTLSNPELFTQSAGTGDSGTGPSGSSGGTATGCPDIPMLLSTSCTTAGACHDATTMSFGLILTEANLPKLVGQNSLEMPGTPIIDPQGDPMNSFLYLKLLPAAASRMPLGGPYFSASTITCVGQWMTSEAGMGGSSSGGNASSSGGAGSSSSSGGNGSSSGVGSSSGGSSSSGVGSSSSGAGSSSGGGMGDGGAAMTFTQLYTSVIMPVCSTCHSGTNAGKVMGMLDMSTKAMAFTNLVGVAGAGSACAGKGTRVVAGKSAMSLLWEKLQPTVPCGMRMPRTGTITPLQIAQVAAWIDAGALNN